MLPQGEKSPSFLRNRRAIAIVGGAAALLTVVLVLVSRPDPAKRSGVASAVGSASPPSHLEPSPRIATVPVARPALPGSAPVTPAPPDQPAPSKDEHEGSGAAPTASALADSRTTPRKPVKRAPGDVLEAPPAHKLDGATRATASSAPSDRRKTVGHPVTSSPGAPTKPRWVDPFEQDGAPAKAAADRDAKRPPKPKRRLIEDL
jgi:hypothetical protein